jgi:penicillin-binding protein 1A
MPDLTLHETKQKLKTSLLKERTWTKRFIKFTWITFLSLLILLPLYIYLVIANPYNIFGGMPSLTAIENPENDLSSEVISSDGVSLGRIFRFNRSQLSYEDLPKPLVRTLIISEDHRFYDHSGMDFWSYLRVVKGLLTFNPQGGGSTLTQQTAKNLYKTRSEDLQGKIAALGSTAELVVSKTKEWIIAVRLEQTFTKEEIIALYLNTVPFSNGSYGIKVASETYFGKPVSRLSLQEIAVLVGILQNNNAFDPKQNPEASLRKRNEILEKLLRHGYLRSQKDYDSIAALPLHLNFKVQNHNQGLATYFRSIVTKDMLKWCRDHGYDLYEAGLKIYTTVDSRLQYLAEEAMQEHMKKLQREFDQQWGNRNPWVDENGNELSTFIDRKLRSIPYYRRAIETHGEDSKEVETLVNAKRQMRVFTWNGSKDTVMSPLDSIRYYNRFLHTGLMSMNPETGEIKAWVGGINHRYFKFDHVLQSRRQPGSTFKAFVYGKAMEDGYSPCAEFQDVSPAISINGQIYQAKNSSGGYGDGHVYTLRQAMAKSLNSVTMQLMEKLQPRNVADFARRMGITSELDPVYPLGLGTSDVSLFEMVGAYATFVNGGINTEPFYITRIEDKHGNVLETFTPKSRQAISRETASKMLYMLKGGVEEEGGTSRALSDYVVSENEVGGKTGTTDDASDGWYMGITQDLVTGVWVGGDERSIRFPTWTLGSGGRSALPMWNKFMEKVYRHPETRIRKKSFTHANVEAECDPLP